MVMPNFLVIGAAKAGTTSLYYYLKQHPEIYMPSSKTYKETNFFALEGETLEYPGPHGTFVMKNCITELETYQSLFQVATNKKAIGEASPVYMYSEKAPHKIKHYIPDVKLIAILRDPVERAFSHYLFWTSQGYEPDTDYNFIQAIKEEPKRIQAGWSYQWHYIQMGFYYLQIKRYFDIFDSSQIKVYLYDDFKNNSLAVVQDIFRFLEVDDGFESSTSKIHNQTKTPKNRHVNLFLNRPNLLKTGFNILVPQAIRQPIANYLKQQNVGKPKLSKKIRRQLIEEYRQDILNLQDLIERDLSSWLEV